MSKKADVKAQVAVLFSQAQALGSTKTIEQVATKVSSYRWAARHTYKVEESGMTAWVSEQVLLWAQGKDCLPEGIGKAVKENGYVVKSRSGEPSQKVSKVNPMDEALEAVKAMAKVGALPANLIAEALLQVEQGYAEQEHAEALAYHEALGSAKVAKAVNLERERAAYRAKVEAKALATAKVERIAAKKEAVKVKKAKVYEAKVQRLTSRLAALGVKVAGQAEAQATA